VSVGEERSQAAVALDADGLRLSARRSARRSAGPRCCWSRRTRPRPARRRDMRRWCHEIGGSAAKSPEVLLFPVPIPRGSSQARAWRFRLLAACLGCDPATQPRRLATPKGVSGPSLITSSRALERLRHPRRTTWPACMAPSCPPPNRRGLRRGSGSRAWGAQRRRSRSGPVRPGTVTGAAAVQRQLGPQELEETRVASRRSSPSRSRTGQSSAAAARPAQAAELARVLTVR